MTQDLIPELRDLLANSITGNAYTNDSHDSDRWLVDHLVEQVRDWESGSTSTEKLLQVFEQEKPRLGGFEILPWIESKVDEGYYDDPWTTEEID